MYNKLIVTFIDGTSIELKTSDAITPIGRAYRNAGDMNNGWGEVITYEHEEDGPVLEFANMLVNYKYFSVACPYECLYSSNSVIRVQQK